MMLRQVYQLQHHLHAVGGGDMQAMEIAMSSTIGPHPITMVKTPEYDIYEPTGEKKTPRWIVSHLLTELFGSFFFVFAGTLQCASPNGGVYGQAAAFSTTFAAVRSFEPSAMLDPLLTVGELFLYPSARTTTGLLIVLCSILCQIAGACLGALFTKFFYGEFPGAMDRTLTMPKDPRVHSEHIVVSEAFFAFLITSASLYVKIFLQCQKKPTNFEEYDNYHEPISISALYLSAIVFMGDLTGGSFIMTRSLGPAIVLSRFDHLYLYVIGQVIGSVSATVFFYTFFYCN